MDSMEYDYTIENIILLIQKRIKQCCGLNQLVVLIEQHDISIDVTKLRHLDSPASIHAGEFDTGFEAVHSGISTNHSIPELPIPYTDKRTVDEAKHAWLQYLTLEKEARMNNDYARADDCREEREKYEDYLTTVVSKRGKIRNIQNQRHTDYIIVKNNFLRLLKKVRDINPDYADYIEAHLEIGHTCMWRTR